MDIKNLTGTNIRSDGPSSGAKTRGPATSGVVTSGATVGGQKEGVTTESLTLTPTARSMTAARESASTVPFDSEKVASIKAAIAEGKYPIDNQKLAARMMSFERALA